ncbi:MAG TPA: dihydroxy-acid dehydratase, partial [Leeuwenhoekiella sp.]|nr:dihydroxy-acid dehydratase [Leeuwenhoekiella sp.]
EQECIKAGEALKYLLEHDIKPSDIVTKESLENAIRLVTVLGGSTNAVLHFLAIAKAAQVDFTLEDFQRL